ncbi:MAG: hypothetical protein ABI147_03165 [Acidobacteriaceae bacterium]
MRGLKVVLIAIFAVVLLGVAPASRAQISVGVGIGAEPVCSYGYYGYAPYRCAPYGYYGPEWFNNGGFIGAGRWHRGGRFYGHVNRSYDPRFGYRGAFPARGGRFDGRDFHEFRGNRWSDERGRYHTDRDHRRYAGHDRDHDGDHH